MRQVLFTYVRDDEEDIFAGVEAEKLFQLIAQFGMPRVMVSRATLRFAKGAELPMAAMEAVEKGFVPRDKPLSSSECKKLGPGIVDIISRLPVFLARGPQPMEYESKSQKAWLTEL